MDNDISKCSLLELKEEIEFAQRRKQELTSKREPTEEYRIALENIAHYERALLKELEERKAYKRQLNEQTYGI